MKKATHSEEQSRPRKADSITKAPSKTARILSHLLTGASLNRFEAESLGDHCLHSTISALANVYMLSFRRQPERVPNHWGEPCRVTRYSLPPSEHKRACAVLASMKRTDKKEACS
ncbi:MAG: hypothetical protein V7772_17465 [Pseudomonas profundi]|uniref:hypothetical protein n=1 Tax=Pseudomonas profundi TaxID=1981513 RepID=UPI0030023537